MAALDTVQNYLDAARILLQDQVSPFRYANTDLVQNLNTALLEARRIRPDLFLANSFTPPTYDAGAPSTSVDIDRMYRMSVVYYIVGMAQLRDDESTQDQRATILLNKFVSQLLGVQS